MGNFPVEKFHVILLVLHVFGIIALNLSEKALLFGCRHPIRPDVVTER